MYIFEIVIALLLAGAVLSAFARRVGAPYPALVALAGAVLAIVPGTPVLLLDPNLALTLFVAPVLLDAAYDASLRDLRQNWRPVAGLALGAVALTVVTVAFVVRMLVPEMGWPAAITLGAIVAPPDAAAATAVLKQLRPPYRLLVILEGESLFNDASALLIYRLALGSAIAGATVSWNVLPMLLTVTAGSLLLGFVAAKTIRLIAGRVQDVSTSIIMQFSSTFGVWILAERLHLSGILTMVVYAMVISRSTSGKLSPRIRVPSYAVWEVTVFVLNVLAFILIGLQLKPIVGRLDRSAWLAYVWIAVVVCVAVVLARIVWVMAVTALSTRMCRQQPGHTDTVAISPRAAALVGWCGMRGIVTLATALALPNGGVGVTPFPQRDLILFIAFAVVLGTLVIQGLTLRPFLNWLQLNDDGSVEHEVKIARVAVLKAALHTASHSSGTETADLIQRRYDLHLRRAHQQLKADTISADNGQASQERLTIPMVAPEEAETVRAVIAAERQQLTALRADGTIGDVAFQRVEQELDWRELDLEQFLQTEQAVS